jgi:hypothetical protein
MTVRDLPCWPPDWRAATTFLHDDARVLMGLTLLLDWHLGRSLAHIASLEVRQ